MLAPSITPGATALVEHIVGKLMLNGEVIRLDGAVRLAAR
jgi:hypothetical protein